MTYCVLNIEDINNVDYSEVLEDSAATTRKNIAKTQFLVKWENNSTPEFISDRSVIPVELMTYSDILRLMATSAWSENEQR